MSGFKAASGVISLGRVLVVQGFVESRPLRPGALGRSKTGNEAMGLELGTPTTGESHSTCNSCSKLVGLIYRGMSEKHFAETPLPLNVSTKKSKACQH